MQRSRDDEEVVWKVVDKRGDVKKQNKKKVIAWMNACSLNQLNST